VGGPGCSRSRRWPRSRSALVVAGGVRRQRVPAGGDVAIGPFALDINTTGNRNVAIGEAALDTNTSGSNNIALGSEAGENLTTGSGNIYIANDGGADESGTIRIGDRANQSAAFIAGIRGTRLGGAAQPVVVNSNGRLGTARGRLASTASLAATVERLQRQVQRLRRQVKGG
jgi:hypothetical protein